MRSTLRPSLLYSSLLAALVLAGCGDGQQGAAPSARVNMGAPATAMAAAAVQPVIFTGAIANYTVTKTDTGYLITDTTGAEAPRTVAATARLRFADMSMAFDVEGTPGQAYRLYRAAFAREPDMDGLGYWIGVLDQGASLYDVAGGFANSAEFKNLYAGAKTNRDIVDQFYVNVLKRQGEQGGMDYWTGILDGKLDTLGGVLRNFSESGENKNGTAAAIATGVRYVEYGVRYPATAYPLRAAYQQNMAADHADFFTVTGTCPGIASVFSTAPVAYTFEGQAATAQSTAVDVSLSSCTTTGQRWTQTDYYDSTGVLQGFNRDSVEYDVGAGSLPATAKIGDKGVYVTQTRYATDSKQTAIGTRTLSYALDTDGSTTNTAILTLTATHTTQANATDLTRTLRYRVGTDGSLQLLTVDERFSNGAYLVYALDPTIVQPKLTVTDTVVGTGAVAQNSNTLTVNYTGWLYDPNAADLKGQKFDSSIGVKPFTFKLGAGQVIGGWDRGMLGMRAGGKRTLVIPSPLGYSVFGSGPVIKPNAALVFDVELISVK